MSSLTRSCQHCGSPVPTSRADAFCCNGCAYVWQMLHEQGFEHFYDLKGTQALPPVAAQALREQDYEWLTAEVEQRLQGRLDAEAIAAP